MSEYLCDKCGACCRHFLIEAYALDVLREPRLLGVPKNTLSLSQLMEDPEGRCVIIGVPGRPCHFLIENQCGIYPTRPNTCVGFQAGSDQCQEARGLAGLEPLQPLTEASV